MPILSVTLSQFQDMFPSSGTSGIVAYEAYGVTDPKVVSAVHYSPAGTVYEYVFNTEIVPESSFLALFPNFPGVKVQRVTSIR